MIHSNYFQIIIPVCSFKALTENISNLVITPKFTETCLFSIDHHHHHHLILSQACNFEVSSFKKKIPTNFNPPFFLPALDHSHCHLLLGLIFLLENIICVFDVGGERIPLKEWHFAYSLESVKDVLDLCKYQEDFIICCLTW